MTDRPDVDRLMAHDPECIAIDGRFAFQRCDCTRDERIKSALADLIQQKKRLVQEVMLHTGCDESEFDDAFWQRGKPIIGHRMGRVLQDHWDRVRQLEQDVQARDALLTRIAIGGCADCCYKEQLAPWRNHD